MVVILLLYSCKTKTVVKVEKEVITEVKEVINTVYTDTGKIITKTEYIYEVKYDTINKTYYSVITKVLENKNENKAISANKKEDRVVVQKAKESSKEVIKKASFSDMVSNWVIVLVLGFVGYLLIRKYLL
jgi:hypothetical protein